MNFKEYGKSISIKRKFLFSEWVTIDPGINCGIARFKENKLEEWKTIYGKGKSWFNKCIDVREQIRPFLVATHTVYIEWPSFQGMIAQNTGSIVKLAYLIGQIASLHSNVILIPVNQWKGNLPKLVTQKRAEKFFNRSGFKNHVADAIGLGQYCIENRLDK